jgi:hypothetical protein
MKNIIFLFSGQARTSPFNINKDMRNMDILKSYNDFIFTDEFKRLYNYKIYISTDDIHLNDTINYFGKENVGNIHLLNTEFYLKPVKNKVDNVEKYLNLYNKKDWSKYQKYDNSIYQHHKIYDCYNLFKEDNIENYDYIVRIRMDIQLYKNIIEIISLFDTKPKLQIVIHHDFFAIGKPEIIDCYCSGLDNNYGNYTYKTYVSDDVPFFYDYHTNDRIKWTYAPERQLFEMLFEYVNKINSNIHEAIIGDYFVHLIR